MKIYFAIIGMGLFVPIGIIIAGLTDDPTTKWLAYGLSAVGVFGVAAGLYRQHEIYQKTQQVKEDEN